MQKTLTDNQHTFQTLDALRGLAALVVVCFHFYNLFGATPFKHGFLAVDFFFILSGFVLAYAYQNRLDNGMSSFRFMKARVIRLYPLYLLALLLGFAFRGLHLVIPASSLGRATPLLVLGLSLLFVPYAGSDPRLGGMAFPYNFPSWSLCCEVVANLFHALFLRRRSTPVLLLLTAIAGTAMILLGIPRGSLSNGTLAVDIPFGIARVLFCYMTGMLIFRLWRTGRFRFRLPPIVFAILLTAVFMLPFFAPFLFWDLLCVTVVFPVLVFFAACTEPPSSLQPVFSLLGTASYAIYVLHVPAAAIFLRFWPLAMRRPADQMPPWSGLSYLVFIVLASLLVDRVYDIPVRRWLRARFGN